MTLLRNFIAHIGAWIIYRLIEIFGKTYQNSRIKWLMGPFGGAFIGDTTYEEVAWQERLNMERHAKTGGLIPDFSLLRTPTFEPERVHPKIKHFYENTAVYAMDVWSRTYFPANIGLALLVTTISRLVNQLNFPLSPLDTALGMTSEIISFHNADGTLRYTGWSRRLADASQRILFTGFYMLVRAPDEAEVCVKAAFPMPNGNATVILRPSVDDTGAFTLTSSGRRFGQAGFYRLQRRDSARVRVWRIRSLKESLRVYVDPEGDVRCDHAVSFLGLPVIKLHYKIFRSQIVA